jgi:hypothetical protein
MFVGLHLFNILTNLRELILSGFKKRIKKIYGNKILTFDM